MSSRIRACAQSLRAKDSKANKANKRQRSKRQKAEGQRSRQLTKQEMMFKDIRDPAYTCRYLYSLACARLCSLKREAARAAKAFPYNTLFSPLSSSPSATLCNRFWLPFRIEDGNAAFPFAKLVCKKVSCVQGQLPVASWQLPRGTVRCPLLPALTSSWLLCFAQPAASAAGNQH